MVNTFGNHKIIRIEMKIHGVVQGVGFRPFVYGLAKRLSLYGFVCNNSSGVTIEIQGELKRIEQFVVSVKNEAPPLSQIDELIKTRIEVIEDEAEFIILKSEHAQHQTTSVSPDVATCEQCIFEMNDLADRRFRYPFINCTQCGPRFTIIRDLPYDRPKTTMADFVMCKQCSDEYVDPASRRFHAQPNACPVCGPSVWYVASNEITTTEILQNNSSLIAEDAIAEFHTSISHSLIVAVKGIGGFHLACDATSDTAIQTLRDRKGRIEKPFAIMMKNVEEARQFVNISDAEEKLLTGIARPVVLLQRRQESPLSELIAPGNNHVGVMLPYAPLHQLLVEQRPLVMTSGNLSNEPIVRTNQEAVERLSHLADGFLLHDRDIEVVCDDSVSQVFRDREMLIRRSRGYAPMPIRLGLDSPEILAVGGELKSTFCLSKNDYAYLSQHIGDMTNLETLEAFQRAVEHMTKLFRINPKTIACDLHPDYLSTRWAERYAEENQIPIIRVQHHHAHIASLLAENKIAPEENVIGICFDGTGYGTDGAIWGGEFLVASCCKFERIAHLRYTPMPGGDACVKNPYRMALAHLWAAGLDWDESLAPVAECSKQERTLLQTQLERNINSPQTSSMGRLFDAVASLIGVRQSVSYEAQAAIEMETMSDDLESVAPYQFLISGVGLSVIDPTPVLEAIVQDVIANVSQRTIAAKFHSAVAELIVQISQRVREQTQLNQVVLSGGVFQNRVLLSRTLKLLEQSGFEVLYHRLVPPNDGGLALGQAVVAASQLTTN